MLPEPQFLQCKDRVLDCVRQYCKSLEFSWSFLHSAQHSRSDHLVADMNWAVVRHASKRFIRLGREHHHPTCSPTRLPLPPCTKLKYGVSPQRPPYLVSRKVVVTQQTRKDLGISAAVDRQVQGGHISPSQTPTPRPKQSPPHTHTSSNSPKPQLRTPAYADSYTLDWDPLARNPPTCRRVTGVGDSDSATQMKIRNLPRSLATATPRLIRNSTFTPFHSTFTLFHYR